MLPQQIRGFCRRANAGRRLLFAAVALSVCGSALAGHQGSASLSPLPDPVFDVIQRSLLVGHTNPSQVLHVAVNMQPVDEAGMQAYADEVSNPTSPNYRKFLTPELIGERFGQSQATVNEVVNYLKGQGMSITRVTKDRMHVLADGTVSQVEAAFHTTINNYHAVSASEAGRTDYFAYSKTPQLPSDMAAVVQHVGGLQNFGKPKFQTTLTPNQARVLYNTAPEFNAQMYGQNRTVAISSWDGYRLSNVPLWYNEYNLPAPPGGVESNITIETIDGGSGTGNPGAEGDLDIQMVLGQAPWCNFIIYDGNASGSGEPTDVYTLEVDDNKADIISESYGWSLNSSTAAACHSDHLSMTMLGITYLVAAGDSGTNIGQYSWPDYEPEVLLVGGGAAQTDTAGDFVSETAWNGGGSGWVQNTYSFNTLPSWQRATGCPTNINYRLVPDIVAQAAGDQTLTYNAVYFYYKNKLSSVSGTSVASPLTAGDLAIAEQKYISLGGLPADGHGHQRFGRINDLLYSQNLRPDVYYDITVGDNGKLPNGQEAVATTGWDFSTGLGSMNWDAFIASLTGGTPYPTISTISPTSTTTGSSLTLTVNGTNYGSQSVVQFNGTNLTTTYVSSTQLTAKVTATTTATAGSFPVTVVNPGPLTSNAVTFNVNNPSPTLSSVTPTSIPQNSGNTTITISGFGFVSTSSALINGTAISTTYVSSKSLTAVIPASDLTSTGNLTLKIKNPTPGGGTSSGLTITVTASNPTPTITTISPTSGTAGTSFTLTVNGTNFLSTSVVQWNGASLSTTYVSATQLTAQVTSTNTATPGTYPVTVVNPGPLTSNAVNFTVNAPLAISSISPTSATQGSSLTLTVNGTGFVSGSTVDWNGSALSTTYVSSTQLTAQVTSTNTSSVGTDSVTVVNPDSTTSNAATFTVTSGLTITSISPTSTTTGSSFTLTVNGTGFVSGAVVQFNGSSLTTTFVSSTQLTAKVTGTNTATAGVYPITVVSNSVTSNAVNLTVNNPVPTLSSVSPTSVAVGSGNTTITLSGFGFISTSTVLINGTPISTTYVSSKGLTAVVPASYFASSGTLTVQVNNPAPGGGTSGKKTITVS